MSCGMQYINNRGINNRAGTANIVPARVAYAVPEHETTKTTR